MYFHKLFPVLVVDLGYVVTFTVVLFFVQILTRLKESFCEYSSGLSSVLFTSRHRHCISQLS